MRMADAVQTVNSIRRANSNILEGYASGVFPGNIRGERNILMYILDAEHHLERLKGKLRKPAGRLAVVRTTIVANGIDRTIIHAGGLGKNQRVRKIFA